MKPILVTDANSEAIEKELQELNGSAARHVFNLPELMRLAKLAEETAHHYILKKDMMGARFTARSGSPVANKYGGPRVGNEMVLERRAKGWYLISLSRCTLGTWAGGETAVLLTPAQDKLAVRAFRAQYSILKTHLQQPATAPQAAAVSADGVALAAPTV